MRGNSFRRVPSALGTSKHGQGGGLAGSLYKDSQNHQVNLVGVLTNKLSFNENQGAVSESKKLLINNLNS